jgi:homogentisate 1,2-dioxygenase
MFPLSRGKVARQAHVGLPDGTFEEEHGREAFEGRASHLYRTHPPTAWIRVEGELRPRAYDLNGLKPADQADPAGEWQRILWNEDVAIYISRPTGPAPHYLRDSDGDLCYFVHRGRGTVETDYGPLQFRPGFVQRKPVVRFVLEIAHERDFSRIRFRFPCGRTT